MKTVTKPKYKIGDVLSVKSTGGAYTGTVIVIGNLTNAVDSPIYLMDLHPGAMGGYDWITVTYPDGRVWECQALNWIKEDDLEPVEGK